MRTLTKSGSLLVPVENGTYAKPATAGTLASRPAATVVGQRFFATDTAGGTPYESIDGATWTQMAAGVAVSTKSAATRSFARVTFR